MPLLAFLQAYLLLLSLYRCTLFLGIVWLQVLVYESIYALAVVLDITVLIFFFVDLFWDYVIVHLTHLVLAALS
jgi:hypothetical protein